MQKRFKSPFYTKFKIQFQEVRIKWHVVVSTFFRELHQFEEWLFDGILDLENLEKNNEIGYQKLEIFNLVLRDSLQKPAENFHSGYKGAGKP